MKCLLCDFKNKSPQELRKHYLEHHRVDSENRFFKKIFAAEEKEQSNAFHGKKCIKCGKFLPTVRSKLHHDFLKHYELSRASVAAVEDKPIRITAVGPIKIYEIRFENHSSDYDFFNSEQIVDEFSFVVKNRIQRSDADVFVRCGFSLENIQPSTGGFDQPLRSSRYWSTDPILTKSFNDFVLFTIRDSVLKRVINNGLTGSSCRFNRFNYINIKVTTTPADNLVR